MSFKDIFFRSCLEVEECLFARELGRRLRLEIGAGGLDLERFSSLASDKQSLEVWEKFCGQLTARARLQLAEVIDVFGEVSAVSLR